MQRLTFLLLISILVSCGNNHETNSEKELVKNYYDLTNQSDFLGISNIVTDSIIHIEGDFILSEGKKDLYRMFQWDSVFEPQYEILELSQDSSLVSVVFSKTCKRIKFLHDTATVSKSLFAFDNEKIASINTVEYILFDYNKWQSRRDTLVAWIDKNHPELNGFIFDQSLLGAKDYLKAIELYQNQN